MKWNSEKVAILKDNYAFADLDKLANQLGTTTKAVIRKAQKLKLYRAKNNQIVNDYKFCSLCQKEHHISEFYKNRAKYDGYEYHCKKYYLTKNNTSPLSASKGASTTETRAKTTELRASTTELRASTTDYVETRPRNPVVTINGVVGKICNSCKEFKPLDAYSKDANGYAQKKATCKLCYKIRYSKKKVE